MKSIQFIFACIAFGLFAWAISHAGLSAITSQFKAICIAVPIVVALSLLRLFLQSYTWAASLKGERIAAKGSTLVGVRVASQSMGYLTVLGPVISEPMKIKLLGTPVEPTITATLLDTGVYWLTSALMAVLGIVCLAAFAAHGTVLRWIPVAFALAIAVFVITRRKSLLGEVMRALGTRAPSWLKRAEAFEASIRTYRLEQPALVARMFWIGIACQFLISFEVVVVLWALHLPIHFLAIMSIEGVTRSLKMASGWVPARVGVDEGGAISAFSIVGLSPMLGLGLALTRRVRDLLWALTGVLWLAWNSRGAGPRSVRQLEFSEEVFERGV
jgi:hypothetical protein